MAVPTAESASSTGTPAANRAPNVSSRMPNVMGRLSSSARRKSPATRSFMPAFTDAVPACATVRSGWSAATCAVAASSAGTRSSARADAAVPVASPTSIVTGSIAERPSLESTRSPTSPTSSSRPNAARSSAATVSACACARVSPTGAWTRTCSVASAGKPASSSSRSARPDSPEPDSAPVSVRMPTAPPAPTATTTSSSQSRTAVHRCVALQRASRRAAGTRPAPGPGAAPDEVGPVRRGGERTDMGSPRKVVRVSTTTVPRATPAGECRVPPEPPGGQPHPLATDIAAGHRLPESASVATEADQPPFRGIEEMSIMWYC